MENSKRYDISSQEFKDNLEKAVQSQINVSIEKITGYSETSLDEMQKKPTKASIPVNDVSGRSNEIVGNQLIYLFTQVFANRIDHFYQVNALDKGTIPEENIHQIELMLLNTITSKLGITVDYLRVYGDYLRATMGKSKKVLEALERMNII